MILYNIITGEINNLKSPEIERFLARKLDIYLKSNCNRKELLYINLVIFLHFKRIV